MQAFFGWKALEFNSCIRLRRVKEGEYHAPPLSRSFICLNSSQFHSLSEIATRKLQGTFQHLVVQNTPLLQVNCLLVYYFLLFCCLFFLLKDSFNVSLFLLEKGNNGVWFKIFISSAEPSKVLFDGKRGFSGTFYNSVSVSFISGVLSEVRKRSRGPGLGALHFKWAFQFSYPWCAAGAASSRGAPQKNSATEKCCSVV